MNFMMEDLKKSTKAAEIIAAGLFGYKGEGPLKTWFQQLPFKKRFWAFHMVHNVKKALDLDGVV